MKKSFMKLSSDLKLLAPSSDPTSRGIFYIKFEADMSNPKNLLITYHMPKTIDGHLSLRSTAAFKMFIGDFEQEGKITQRNLAVSWDKLRQDMLANSDGAPEVAGGFLKTFFQRKNFQFMWNEVFFPYFESTMQEKVYFKKFLKYSVESLEVYLLNLNLPRAASFFLAASTLIDEFEGSTVNELMELARKSEDPVLLEVVDVITSGFQEAGVDPGSLESFNAALDALDERDEQMQEKREERIEEEIACVVSFLENEELAKEIEELAKDIRTNARALKANLLMAWPYIKDGNCFMMCEYAIMALDEFIPLDEQTTQDEELVQEEIKKEAAGEELPEILQKPEEPATEPTTDPTSEEAPKEETTEQKEGPSPEPEVPEKEEEEPIIQASGDEVAFLQAILPEKFEEPSTLSLNPDTETLRAFEHVIHENEGATTEELKALEDQSSTAVVKVHLHKAQILHFIQEKGIVIGEGVEVFYGPYEVGQHLPGTIIPFSMIKGKVEEE